MKRANTNSQTLMSQVVSVEQCIITPVRKQNLDAKIRMCRAELARLESDAAYVESHHERTWLQGRIQYNLHCLRLLESAH